MTDCLQIISENTAGLVKGKALQKRFCEIAYEDMQKKNVIEKSAEEIVKEVTEKAGLVVI